MTTRTSTQALIDEFARTTDQIVSLDELRALLDSGRQLRIKYGVDVTAPTLHTGHAVNMWMMRRLQDEGHKVVFLIGDFTTRIGDPTGRSGTRPQTSREDIERNAEEFIEQAKMVLRFDDPELIEIRRNSEWLDPLGLDRFLELLAMLTHSRLVSRDMFKRRIAEGHEIHMHEMLYPVLQGYDSFALESDLTIIGTDQLFNEMLGRFYQEKLGQVPQVVITTRITPGIDGGQKQSKSIGNYVGLAHSPRDKFGRLMRVPDALVRDYLETYTALEMPVIDEIAKLGEGDPLEAKKRMSCAVVARYHGDEVAQAERDWFEKTFARKEVSEDAAEETFDASPVQVADLVRRGLGDDQSNSQVRRLVEQGGVRIDGEKASDAFAEVDLAGSPLVQIGKRIVFRAVAG
jgi:tyrosyl-tRNA synthetase